MNLFRKATSHLFKKGLHSVYNRSLSSTNVNIQANQEIQKSLELMGERRYQEASETLSELLKSLEDYKGSVDYNKILQVHAQCFNGLKQYKDAEQCYLNVLEYMKFRSTDFSSQDFLDARLSILNQYLISNIFKGGLILEEIYQQHFSQASHEDKVLIDYYKGLLMTLDRESFGADNFEEAKKHFVSIMNRYRDVPEFCVYSAHTIGMINWWKQQETPEKADELRKEVVEHMDNANQPKLLNDIQTYINKFYRNNLEPQDFQGVLSSLTFSLTLGHQFGGFADPMSIQKVLDNECNIVPENFLTCLTLSEILMETKGYRQKGKQILDMVERGAEENNVDMPAKGKILRAAYNIDTKNYQNAISVLDDLLENEVAPWEDYYKLMAYKFMVFALKKTDKDVIKMNPLQEEIVSFEEDLPQWSSKLAHLYVPMWKHVTEQEDDQ